MISTDDSVLVLVDVRNGFASPYGAHIYNHARQAELCVGLLVTGRFIGSGQILRSSNIFTSDAATASA